MKARPKLPPTLSRRRFVAMVAAGSAALLAAPARGAVPARKPVAARAAAQVLAPRDRAELVRQKAATLDTLKRLRAHDMPPGTEMASVFRPLKSRRREG